MNGFYLAKKTLKYAGYLDLFFAVAWSIFFLIIAIYNICGGGSETFTTYSEYFKTVIKDFHLFQFSVWHLVLLFLISTIGAFVLKVLLGIFSMFWFYKSKNLMLFSSAVFVVFLPLIGGIVAVNTYHATTSSLAPRYISPYALLRGKIRSFIGAWLGNADNQ